MQKAKSFDRGDVFRQINARRLEINRDMIYDREVGRSADPEKLAELELLAAREDALLESGYGALLQQAA